MTFWLIVGLIAWGLVTLALLFGPFIITVNLGDYDWFMHLRMVWRVVVRTGVIVVGLLLAAGSGAGFGMALADHLGPGIPPDGCYQIKRVLVPSVVSTGKVTVVSENAVPEFYPIACPGGS